MNFEHEIINIEPIEDDKFGRVGLVDVRLKLKGEDFLDTVGACDVRVYFTDSSMSFEQIKTEALCSALTVLSRGLEISAVPAIPEDFHFRWK